MFMYCLPFIRVAKSYQLTTKTFLNFKIPFLNRIKDTSKTR